MLAAVSLGAASSQITAEAQPLPGGVPDISPTAAAASRFLGFHPGFRWLRGLRIGLHRWFHIWFGFLGLGVPLILIFHAVGFRFLGFLGFRWFIQLGAVRFMDVSGHFFQVGLPTPPAWPRIPFTHLPRFHPDR